MRSFLSPDKTTRDLTKSIRPRRCDSRTTLTVDLHCPISNNLYSLLTAEIQQKIYLSKVNNKKEGGLSKPNSVLKWITLRFDL